MAMLNRNLIRNNAAVVGAAARLLRQGREDVSSALLGVGFLTCATAARAAASRPARSGLAYSVYLTAHLGSLICGASTIYAAGWVAGDPARCRAAGRKILFASLFPMIITFSLSNDPDFFFDILRAIA